MRSSNRVKSRRVLLITDIFPPLVGGPASFIDELAHHLAARGHRVTVVCAMLDGRRDGDSVRPFRVSRVPRDNQYRFEIEMRMRLLVTLATHGTIFVNGLEDYLAPIVRVLRRRPVVKVVGDYVWERARNRGETVEDIERFQGSVSSRPTWQARRERLRRFLEAARGILVPSHYLSKLVQEWGLPASKVTVVPNGGDGSTSDDRLAPELRPVRVLYVGRLTNWKGVETALLACARAAGATITIAGDGPEQPMLQHLADQIGLGSRAAFLGRVDRSRVADLYATHDVLVLSSLYEGMSHTILEAMASGLPVIASDCGGNSELVRDRVEGFLVPPLRPDAIASCLDELLGSTALWSAMSRSARRRAAEFNKERSLRDTADILLRD